MAHSSLDLALERTSDVPLGTQLAWRLRAAIAGGALRPGDRLPPVRELAATAGVNVNTVRAVYARLAERGVIESEHGRGTFVAAGPGTPAGLGAMAERAAREARSHGVDPRELAAVLYARYDDDAGAAPVPLDGEAAARGAVRAEIEALEHELARLEPHFADRRAAERASGGQGARLVTARELEATRDELAARVSARRRELRAARTAARSGSAKTRAGASEWRPRPSGPSPASAWPELLASAR